jgi:hypothetical protein
VLVPFKADGAIDGLPRSVQLWQSIHKFILFSALSAPPLLSMGKTSLLATSGLCSQKMMQKSSLEKDKKGELTMTTIKKMLS